MFRGIRFAKKAVLGLSVGAGLAVWGHRSWKLRGDRVLNPYRDPFLDFAEQQRRQGKQLFKPWITPNKKDLKLAKQLFPEIAIPQPEQLVPPNMHPIDILPLKDLDVPLPTDQPKKVRVGGPSAAMRTLAEVMEGSKDSLYVTDTHATQQKGKQSRPIMAGAANLFVTDAMTIAPAYTSGNKPDGFLYRSLKQFINPPRFDKEVMADDYPWLGLNLTDWVKNPSQWGSGLRVMWGNHQLASQYATEMKSGAEPKIWPMMRDRARNTTDFLEKTDAQLGGIFRQPSGLLISVPDEKFLAHVKEEEKALAREGQQLPSIHPYDAKAKYGFAPSNSLTLREKPTARIFDPRFVQNVSTHIKTHGGEVVDHWHLNRVFVDTEKQTGGVLEFTDSASGKGSRHYVRFSEALLSLGSTPFKPNPYDLISVSGVSVNALVRGVKLSGGSIIRGTTVHIVPLAEPKTITIKDPETGEEKQEDVSFVRVTAAGVVGPLNRGQSWYDYDGKHAVFLMNQLRKTLPSNSTASILSVVGCNRLIGKDGRQMEVHPTVMVDGKAKVVKTVTVQAGAGGAGLIQSGAIASVSSPSAMEESKPDRNRMRRH